MGITLVVNFQRSVIIAWRQSQDVKILSYIFAISKKGPPTVTLSKFFFENFDRLTDQRVVFKFREIRGNRRNRLFT